MWAKGFADKHLPATDPMAGATTPAQWGRFVTRGTQDEARPAGEQVAIITRHYDIRDLTVAGMSSLGDGLEDAEGDKERARKVQEMVRKAVDPKSWQTE